MRAVPLIEPLEDRIAPSGGLTIAPNGKSATYADASGDTIKVTTTKGRFETAQFTFDPSNAGQLTELDISGVKSFSGANIAFTVAATAPGGSATINIGYIDAMNLSLGSVTVPGDLGRIDVGGGSTPTALGKLTVNSLGADSSTQNGLSYSTLSNIIGAIGTVNVAGNIDGALFAQDYNSKPGTGNVNRLNVGGSVDGNTSSGAGVVFFTGTLGAAVIDGGIEGGSGYFSGSIGGYDSASGGFGTLSKIGSIKVLGSVPDDPNPSPVPGAPGTSILGGSGTLSGSIDAVTIGNVYVAGDIYGGAGTASGAIQAGSRLAKVTVQGSLIGGNFAPGSPTEANSAGLIFGANIGSVFIGKNVYGGSGLSSGEIFALGTLQTVTVMGNVYGGTGGSSSSNGFTGAIRGHALGNVTIQGALIGGNSVSGDSNQTGTLGGAILSDTSIGTVYIGQNVVGGSGGSSGIISAEAGGVKTLTIGLLDATSGASADNSLVGGSGASSGEISIGGTTGKILMTHGLAGGSGSQAGLIQINGQVNSLTIMGDVTGGTGDNTGTISTFGLLKNASIQGNIVGSNSGASILTNTGYIQAAGIGVLDVTGALISGTSGAGGIDTSGAIRSTASIKSLTIGSIEGNPTNPAIISAVGNALLVGAPKTDVAIQSVTVLGNASYGDILAGYSTNTNGGADPLGTGVNANAQIGTVTIGGNLMGTNIIAGVAPGTNGYFGTASSAALSGAGVADLPSLISTISKIIITGNVLATPNTSDSYGIAAQYIKSATVGGAVLPLVSGADNDTFAAGKEQRLPSANGDEYLYEV